MTMVWSISDVQNRDRFYFENFEVNQSLQNWRLLQRVRSYQQRSLGRHVAWCSLLESECDTIANKALDLVNATQREGKASTEAQMAVLRFTNTHKLASCESRAQQLRKESEARCQLKLLRILQKKNSTNSKLKSSWNGVGELRRVVQGRRKQKLLHLIIKIYLMHTTSSSIFYWNISFHLISFCHFDFFFTPVPRRPFWHYPPYEP